jgi:hypothetical protein
MSGIGQAVAFPGLVRLGIAFRSHWHGWCKRAGHERRPHEIRVPQPLTAAFHGRDGPRDRAQAKCPRWTLFAGAGGCRCSLLLAFAWWLIAARCNRQTVPIPIDVTISEVRRGTFDDFLPLRSLVLRRCSPSIWMRSRAGGSSARFSWRMAPSVREGAVAGGDVQRGPAALRRCDPTKRRWRSS